MLHFFYLFEIYLNFLGRISHMYDTYIALAICAAFIWFNGAMVTSLSPSIHDSSIMVKSYPMDLNTLTLHPEVKKSLK